MKGLQGRLRPIETFINGSKRDHSVAKTLLQDDNLGYLGIAGIKPHILVIDIVYESEWVNESCRLTGKTGTGKSLESARHQDHIGVLRNVTGAEQSNRIRHALFQIDVGLESDRGIH